MKKPCYISAPGLVTPLGFSVEANFEKLLENTSAIKKHSNKNISNSDFYAAMLDVERIDKHFEKIQTKEDYTKLEKMMLLSIAESLDNASVEISEKTALIVATTKGNVDVLEKGSSFEKNRAYLPVLAKKIASFFGFKTEPIVVSNACVSGILAVATAKRLIEQGMYQDAVVVAGDLVTKFTFSGFQSFQALSYGPCKPYSKYRKGLTLGEAAASVFISTQQPTTNGIEIMAGTSCNDANHISGPSRTGEGLYKSVKEAMNQAAISENEIDFISAHGTATLYNDEMEAIAFNRLHLQHVPLHSLKGVFGHTLGASGLLETIIAMEMMKRNMLIPSYGYDELGVSKQLNIIQEPTQRELSTVLKTASGFGGCNTAVLFKKVS